MKSDLTPFEILLLILNLSFIVGAGFTIVRLVVEGLFELVEELSAFLGDLYYSSRARARR